MNGVLGQGILGAFILGEIEAAAGGFSVSLGIPVEFVRGLILQSSSPEEFVALLLNNYSLSTEHMVFLDTLSNCNIEFISNVSEAYIVPSELLVGFQSGREIPTEFLGGLNLSNVFSIEYLEFLRGLSACDVEFISGINNSLSNPAEFLGELHNSYSHPVGFPGGLNYSNSLPSEYLADFDGGLLMNVESVIKTLSNPLLRVEYLLQLSNETVLNIVSGIWWCVTGCKI